MLNLEKNAKIVITDSGGVQEESCILGVPCVTVRESTERPETVEIGANIIAGAEPEKILAASLKIIEKKPVWKNPFGDGHSAENIIKIIENDR